MVPFRDRGCVGCGVSPRSCGFGAAAVFLLPLPPLLPFRLCCPFPRNGVGGNTTECAGRQIVSTGLLYAWANYYNST